MDITYFNARPMAANTSTKIGPHMGGFLATVAGTLTVTDSSGAVIVNALPVAVGFNRIPINLNFAADNVVQLAGGAAGTLLV
jgi:hypothetical protein